MELKELVEKFGNEKAKLDSLKKELDKDNLEIKDLMTKMELSEYNSDNYKAELKISHRTILDEDEMARILQGYWIDQTGDVTLKNCPYLKMKVVVDMDELENALFHSEIDKQIVQQLDECRSEKEIVSLYIKEKH